MALVTVDTEKIFKDGEIKDALRAAVDQLVDRVKYDLLPLLPEVEPEITITIRFRGKEKKCPTSIRS
jgi:hypothetical protein